MFLPTSITEWPQINGIDISMYFGLDCVGAHGMPIFLTGGLLGGIYSPTGPMYLVGLVTLTNPVSLKGIGRHFREI